MSAVPSRPLPDVAVVPGMRVRVPFGSSVRIGIVVDGCVTMGGESFMPGESFMIPYAALAGELSGSGRLLFILPPDCH